MVKRILIGIMASLLLMAAGTPDQYDTNAKIKSIYIYNFTKYIEWPDAYKSGNFVIGILGDSNVKSSLEAMAATKKAANQPFEIKQFSSVDQITACHILFIPRKQGQNLSAVKQKVSGGSTLIITEEDGLATQGAGINFIVQENKQKFELNKSNIEPYQLQISSSLLALAVLVGS